MKTRLLVIPLLILALCGCTTTPTGQSVPDPAVLQLTAQEAAAIGTQFRLQSHPGDRPAFELARTSLRALIATGKGSPSDLQAALAALPITQLQGTNGAVIVTTAAVLISRAGAEVIKLDKNSIWSFYVEPVAQGLADGLDMALGKPGASIPAPLRNWETAEVKPWTIQHWNDAIIVPFITKNNP